MVEEAEKEKMIIKLNKEKKIFISETGLEAPAFNQKTPYVHLINEKKENEVPLLLLLQPFRC